MLVYYRRTVGGKDRERGTPMRLLDQVREVIRKKHYSIRTEQAYVQWLCRAQAV